MSFSILHEYTFAMIDEDHCSVVEYANEIAGPVDKGDICDIHFEYHLSYILPSTQNLMQTTQIDSKPVIQKESYNKKIIQDFIIPPSV